MSPRPEHLVETSLVVSDLDRARSFYERIFGLEAVILENDMVGLQLPDGAVLLLFSAMNERPNQLASSAPHLRFVIPQDALQQWNRHLMMHGIVVESRVQGHDGASSLYFRDPDHNSLEVMVEPA